MIDKIDAIINKLNGVVSEKSDKVMTNKKVEGLVNNVGGAAAFLGAIAFGVVFIMCTASLMKTGKNYVVRPAVEATEAKASEEAETEESADTEAEETEEESSEGEEE
ncbi:MAG: hypothetical protein FJ264_12495 [Planctomycetes bacterium]|nr:hypothetical protein [Planctomycetota bacterium]